MGHGVGPRSAGANPGPVCYGKGGEQSTVTDANLLRGYLRPGGLLGGTAPPAGPQSPTLFPRAAPHRRVLAGPPAAARGPPLPQARPAPAKIDRPA